MTQLVHRRILVVDDSPAVRAQLEALIEPYGFEVEHAADGAAALRLVEGGGYTLVLLDLHMPVLDGPTTLRLLRQRGHQVPVALVTSSADTRLLATTIRLGTSDYVSKPFDAREIRAMLARSLGLAPEALVADAPRALVADAEPATVEALRAALPPHVEVDQAASATEADRLLTVHAYRLVLVDGVSSGRDAADRLGRWLRQRQPGAALFLLDDPVRTSDGRRRTATGPFDGVVPRPPDARVVGEFLYPSCLRTLVTRQGGLVSLAAFRGLDEDAEVYFRMAERRLGPVVAETMKEAVGARVDLSRAPALVKPLASLVRAVEAIAEEQVTEATIVVSPQMMAALRSGEPPCRAPLSTPAEID